MIFYTQIVAMLIDFNLYDFREIIIILSWVPIFTIPHLLSQNKIIYKIGLSIFFVDGFINLCHWLILKGPVSASSFFIIANTNMSETMEFMSLKFNTGLLLLIPYIFLFIYALLKMPEVKLYKNSKYIIALIMSFSLIFMSENIIGGRFTRKAIPQTTKAIIFFSNEIKEYKRLQKRTISDIEATTMLNPEDNHVLLLIIGESVNRNHMSLYGYHKKTTPKLDKRDDIIVYNNVISPYSNTLSSILTILTNSNLENNISMYDNISLIDIFHSAKFKTFWISNQSPIGIWDNGVFNLAQTADIVIYQTGAGNSSYESTLIPSYDEVLFAPLKLVLKDTAKNKFIIMQLMGSHSAYSKRYPSDFGKFSNHSNKKEKTVNEYDNSILYNDFIIDSLINTLSRHSQQCPNVTSAMIYLSDHGENVYDENNNAGHDYSGSLPKSNVEIPFIVWLSDNYIRTNSTKIETITHNTGLPFVSDDLFHSVIDISNIKTPSLITERSIFNSNYNSIRKRILEDRMDYDLKH